MGLQQEWRVDVRETLEFGKGHFMRGISILLEQFKIGSVHVSG